MKHLLYSVIIITSLFISSCDNLLDLSPEDYFTEGNYWKTETQVNGFMTGLHNQLRGASNTFFELGERRGGLMRSGGTIGVNMTNAAFIEHQLRPSTTFGNWAGFYGHILQLNIAIERLKNGLPFLSTQNNNFFQGQLYGMRALYYFHLLRTYGGVPLVKTPKVVEGITNPQDLYTPRSSEEEVLSFIKEDIAASENFFKDDAFTMNDKRDRWSKAATLMLKAEVYLWSAKVYNNTKDLDNSMAALKEIQNAGKFKLMDNFEDVFTYKHKGNDEIIFAFHYELGEGELPMRHFMYGESEFQSYYDRNGNSMKDPLRAGDRCQLFNEYKFELFESYDDNDSRRDFTFLDFYNNDKTVKGIVLKKFLGIIDSGTNSRSYCDDMPMYRYADVLLMMAEIKNKKNEDPSDEINMIRRRACGEHYVMYVNKSFEENELAILHERDKEFVREGKRWYDVRRMQDKTGKPLAFTEGMLPENEAYKLLWPIDVGTLTQDPTIVQTPGYENM